MTISEAKLTAQTISKLASSSVVKEAAAGFVNAVERMPRVKQLAKAAALIGVSAKIASETGLINQFSAGMEKIKYGNLFHNLDLGAGNLTTKAKADSPIPKPRGQTDQSYCED